MRRWEWKGKKNAANGVATYFVGRSEVRVALPDFQTAHTISEALDEARRDGAHDALGQIRATVESMQSAT